MAPSERPDLISKASSQITRSLDQNEAVLSQLISTRNNYQQLSMAREVFPHRSFNSTQSMSSTLPDSSRFPRQNEYWMRIVEGSWAVIKMEKELIFKNFYTLRGPFGYFLNHLEELFAVESVPCTPSSAPPICRIGQNVTLLTSEICLPLKRDISSERLWCFRTDGITRAANLHLPSIPAKIKHVKTVERMTIELPYAILLHRKMIHKKERTSVIETIELRSIGAVGEAEIEIFTEPKDLKTEKLAYSERIFIGNRIIRIVSECSLRRDSLHSTEVTRHFFKADLLQTEPVLSTAKESSVSSIKLFLYPLK